MRSSCFQPSSSPPVGGAGRGNGLYEILINFKPTALVLAVALLCGCAVATAGTNDVQAVLRWIEHKELPVQPPPGSPSSFRFTTTGVMAKYPGSETWYLYRGAPPEFKGIESLPEDERNTIALAAAKTLAFRDYPEGMTPAQWADYLEKKWHNWIPEETGIKKWSAELLHSLSETRLLTTPEVFPYLIEGLRHPSGSVYSPCWQALSLLTQHRSGWRTFHEAYGTNALAMRQQCLTWWQEWWAENKNKSPIFDRAIEERTRHAFWRVTKELEKLKTEFPELAFYQAPRFYQAPEERKGSAWTFSVDDFQDIGAFAGKLTTLSGRGFRLPLPEVVCKNPSSFGEISRCPFGYGTPAGGSGA